MLPCRYKSVTPFVCGMGSSDENNAYRSRSDVCTRSTRTRETRDRESSHVPVVQCRFSGSTGRRDGCWLIRNERARRVSSIRRSGRDVNARDKIFVFWTHRRCYYYYYYITRSNNCNERKRSTRNGGALEIIIVSAYTHTNTTRTIGLRNAKIHR